MRSVRLEREEYLWDKTTVRKFGDIPLKLK